jgi:hypothetical protein
MRARRRSQAAGTEDAPGGSRRFFPVLIGLLIGVAVPAGIASGQRWARSAAPEAAPSESAAAEPVAVLGACSGKPTCIQAADLAPQAKQLLALITAERARAGCRPVTLDTRLIQAAQLAVGSMVDSQVRTPHVDAAQRTPQDRAEFTGYHGRVVEVIAVGLATPARVMQVWLDERVNPSIRARLDNCASVAMGIDTLPAPVRSTYGPGAWAVVLGQPETAP